MNATRFKSFRRIIRITNNDIGRFRPFIFWKIIHLIPNSRSNSYRVRLRFLISNFLTSKSKRSKIRLRESFLVEFIPRFRDSFSINPAFPPTIEPTRCIPREFKRLPCFPLSFLFMIFFFPFLFFPLFFFFSPLNKGYQRADWDCRRRQGAKGVETYK